MRCHNLRSDKSETITNVHNLMKAPENLVAPEFGHCSQLYIYLFFMNVHSGLSNTLWKSYSMDRVSL